MATIVHNSSWPTNSSKQVGQIWMEMSQPPAFMKLMWAGVDGVDNSGIRGLVLWQCEDSHIADAYAFIREDVSRYFTIPGYTYSYNIWTEPVDALKMVGLM